MSGTTDSWNPGQYEQFKSERSAPFFDLLQLLRPVPGGRAVDLGCGTGELTVQLHRASGVETTLGVDRSRAMLERALRLREAGVDFVVGDIGDPAMLAEIGAAGRDPYDIVLANAALQWVPNHERVLTAWTAMLAPGGQLAVQVPANVDHPSHTTSAELAAEEPYLSAFGGEPPPDPVHSVLKPEEYATFLHDLGYVEQHVRLQVYGHVLPGPDAVVEWVKGTSLTRFSERLPAELFEEFLAEYRKRLTDRLQNRSPYFYAFKRILVWARLGS